MIHSGFGVFFKHFPEAVFDKTNYSRINLERYFQNIKEKNLEPPEYITDSKWEIAFQNGPTFKAKIPYDNNESIKVVIKRFSVEFNADFTIDNKVEIKIIEFLKLLEYGTIKSNQQTENFSRLYKDQKDYWILADV